VLKGGRVLLGGGSIFLDVAMRLRTDAAQQDALVTSASRHRFSGTCFRAIAEAFEVQLPVQRANLNFFKASVGWQGVVLASLANQGHSFEVCAARVAKYYSAAPAPLPSVVDGTLLGGAEIDELSDNLPIFDEDTSVCVSVCITLILPGVSLRRCCSFNSTTQLHILWRFH
jgi:hypothetical protein